MYFSLDYDFMEDRDSLKARTFVHSSLVPYSQEIVYRHMLNGRMNGMLASKHPYPVP